MICQQSDTQAIRKELWERKLANVLSRLKEMYGEKLFPRPRKGILERDEHFFGVLLSQMDLRNVEMQKNVSFCLSNREICDKIYR